MLSLVASTIFISCSNDIEAIYEITASEDIPTFLIVDLETYYSDSGIVQIKIFAPELLRYERKEIKYDEYPKGLKVEFYDNSMNLTSVLKCQYAKYFIEKDLWEAKNNVEVYNIEKDEFLNTELLYWDIKNEKIYSDKFVRIKTEKEILFGQGFESNQEFSQWRILKPTGEILIKDDE